MAPFENLMVGSWVAICAVIENEEVQVSEMGPWITVTGRNPEHWCNVDGRPYQIHAISLPFMALYCPVNKHLFPIDYRRVEFQLLDKAYVLAFSNAKATQCGLVPGCLPKDHYAHE